MAKDYMIIDGHRVEYTDEKNILAVVRKAGIDLPTFCYYSELSVYGACRMCMVEDKRGAVIPSCSTPPRCGMEIKTHTTKLQKHRKMILELLLSSGHHDCTTCQKSGACRLQELASRFGINSVRFPQTKETLPIDDSSVSIVRDPNKCILCGDCVRVCSEIQNVGAIDFMHRGSNMVVSTAFDQTLCGTSCVKCGQCAAVCPTGAIVVTRNTDEVWKQLYNPNKRIVVQIAPAVRVALGEEFGLKNGENVMGKTVAALRKLGFDEIYDTSMSADVTVMEESKEFLKRLEKEENLPLFTSCCPAWIRYAETKHPELLKNISTCRSPQQMFGSMVKEYYRMEENNDGRETVSLSIMPCTAKKFEAQREEFVTAGERDVDYVLTTQELAWMFKEAGITFAELEPEAPDMPFGMASGAGVIFGVTGGVTEAVIRRVVKDKSAAALHNIGFTGVRGMAGIKETSIKLGDRVLKIAVVSGLKNAEDLIQKIESGETHYDFVEVMACPGGCISGAGQPFALKEGKEKRAKGIYSTDKLTQIKRSQDNPMVASLYEGMLKNRTHELLHIRYTDEK